MSSLKMTVQKAFDKALSENALSWMKSGIEIVPDSNVKFQIRYVPALAKKPRLEKDSQPSAPKPFFNPFNPPDPNLLVSSFPTHNLVLNKFCINRDHFILSTKTYVIQNQLLNASDFRVIWNCIQEWDSERSLLVFHNCGPRSGASQPHKHVQAIPAADGLGIPVDEVIVEAGKGMKPGELFVLPAYSGLVHSVAMLPDSLDEEALLKIYRTVVSAAFELLGIDISVYDKVDLDAEQMDDAVPSHNLLLTRRWILCVPRANEMFEGVGANSVGFAGWLLATDEAGLSKLKEQGPLYFLQNLGHRL